MVTKYLVCTTLLLSFACHASSKQDNIHTLYTSLTTYRHAMQLPTRSAKKRKTYESRITQARKIFSTQVADVLTKVSALENRAFQATPRMSLIEESQLVKQTEDAVQKSHAYRSTDKEMAKTLLIPTMALNHVAKKLIDDLPATHANKNSLLQDYFAVQQIIQNKTEYWSRQFKRLSQKRQTALLAFRRNQKLRNSQLQGHNSATPMASDMLYMEAMASQREQYRGELDEEKYRRERREKEAQKN